jgi:hypothetical protein
MTGLEDVLRDTLTHPPIQIEPPADPVALLAGRLRLRRTRRRLAAGGAAAAVVAVLAGAVLLAPGPRDAVLPAVSTSPSTSAAVAEVPPPAAVLARARAISAGLAGNQPGNRNRVEGPIEWVRTTRAAASRVTGLQTAGGAADQVYVMQVHGSFCCHPVPIPAPGQPTQDGTYRAFFEVLPTSGLRPGELSGPGGSSGDQGLDLTRLGTVHTFPLP